MPAAFSLAFRLRSALLALAAGALAHPARAQAAALVPDPPAQCGRCAEWNAPRAPFRLYGNTWFVGPTGVSSLLITTPQGHILIDGGLTQSAAVIDANIRELGFKTTDIKLILTSHGHYDHMGGLHALQRYTGATVLASPGTARALTLGEPVPEDPQVAHGPVDHFPKVAHIRIVHDGEEIVFGGVTLMPHAVPGHTPGATTWTWRSCEVAGCLNMVYADSLSAVSNDGYRFTGDATHPGLVATFRASIRTVAALPCDVMVSTHPSVSNMDEKLRKRAATKPGDADPFIQPDACRMLADDAMKALDDRVKAELARK